MVFEPLQYSCLGGKTPDDIFHNSGPSYQALPAATKMPKLDHIPDGNVILIRFIRSDCKLDIFGEKFTVSKKLVYSYVKAVIVTDLQTIQVYLGDDLVEVFHYEMPS